VEWKATIEAKVDLLVVGMAKMESFGGVYGKNQGHVGK
jgi:hypothetical protein